MFSRRDRGNLIKGALIGAAVVSFLPAAFQPSNVVARIFGRRG